MKEHFDKSAVWAEIKLSAITHNIKELKKLLDPSTKFMAVVKANAYGHGAINVTHAVKKDVDYFGVSRISEALELRKAKINTPILIFGYTPPDMVELLSANKITASVYDYEMAEKLSNMAVKTKKKLKVHIKIDTGMCRVGIFIPNIKRNTSFKEPIEKAAKEIEKISLLPALDIEGIFTHFSNSDSTDPSNTEKQLEIFNELNENLSRKKINFEIKHAANSAGMINFKHSHLDMVRPGISLYGFRPNNCLNNNLTLQAAMEIKAIIAHVKKVPRGCKVGYNGVYTTQTSTTISTIPIGYADGYRWNENPSGHVLIHGKKAPIGGSICMDFIMADTGHIENVAPGDEAVILGTQGNAVLSAEEVAASSHTTPYEVVSSLTARIHRLFKN